MQGLNNVLQNAGTQHSTAHVPYVCNKGNGDGIFPRGSEHRHAHPPDNIAYPGFFGVIPTALTDTTKNLGLLQRPNILVRLNVPFRVFGYCPFD